MMKQSLNETSDFESKLQLNQLLNESIGTIADFIKQAAIYNIKRPTTLKMQSQTIA